MSSEEEFSGDELLIRKDETLSTKPKEKLENLSFSEKSIEDSVKPIVSKLEESSTSTSSDRSNSDISVPEESQKTDMEAKEIPNINVEGMKMEELRKSLVDLSKNHPITSIKREVEKIREAAKSIFSQERNTSLQNYLENGNEEKDFGYKDEVYESLTETYRSFRSNLQAYRERQELEQEANLKIREEIIEELKALYTIPSENNKVLFQKFQELKNRWNQTGFVPKTNLSTLYKNYYHHLDNFYEYLNLNKELREMNYAENLKMQEVILIKAEEILNQETNFGKGIRELQRLHKRWKAEAVPVAPEHRETNWNRFKELSDLIHQKKASQDEAYQKKREENIQEKRQIIQEIKTLINAEKPINNRDYIKFTKQVDVLSEKFRAVGAGPKKENDEIWLEFKSIYKDFNKEKNLFFKKAKEEYNQNLQKKEELIEIAKSHQSTQKWDASLNEMKRIQREWKQIGFIPRKKSDELWKEFKFLCDAFFDQYKNRNVQKQGKQTKSLEAKTAFLKKIKKVKLEDNKENVLQQIGKWTAQWNDLGEVPDQKNKIEFDFIQFLGNIAKSSPVNNQEIQKAQNEVLLKNLESSQSSKEIEKQIVEASSVLKKLNEEIIQLENNMGFFTQSKKENPLLKGVKENLDQKLELKESQNSKLRMLKKLF